MYGAWLTGAPFSFTGHAADLFRDRVALLDKVRRARAELPNPVDSAKDQGVSGVVVIAESHLSIHTWPEFGYAALDIFTCGTDVQPEKAAEVMVEKLGSKNHSLQEIQRGILVTV